jgi:putative hydrolase of the HAD superfamily
MATASHYAAISFDVGYTLIEPHQEAPAIVAALLAEHDIRPEPALLTAAYVRAERLFLEDYFRPLNQTWTADALIQRFYRGYYAQLLADLGLTQDVERHTSAIIARYLDPANWRLYPGVLETLTELHAAGYRLGVASDWGSGLTRILHRLGLSRYLDWALISGAIGFAKPSPQFYRLAVLRAAVPAPQMLHVGDSYYADVRGARTVGMDALLIDWRGRNWPPLDVPVIHALAELPAYLAALQP